MNTARFDGLLVLDKPGGMTSRAVVDRAQLWFPRRTRIGHTGTLDPLATGVLVLCVGQATRLTEYVQALEKVYETCLVLGARSDTDDADGTIEPVEGAAVPERARVAECLPQFIGSLSQVPPAFSAAKVAGRRAYDLARQGEELSLRARQIDVYGIDLLAYDHPRLDLRVHCGKGTYIRSLARDLGETLGCGAYVRTLRRLRIGPFDVKDALSLETDAAMARARLLPVLTAVAGLPRLTVEAGELARLRHGQGIPLIEPFVSQSGGRASEIAVLDRAGDLVAVATVDPTRKRLLPSKVLLPGLDRET